MKKQALTIRQKIITFIKRSIIEGKYKPGERLPTRSQLEKQFATSPITVQRAMDQLAREGFIEVRQRKLGTIVSRRPPHLHHYRFIMPFPLDSQEMRSPFMQTLRMVAADLEANRPGTVCTFCGLSDALNADAINQLLSDLRAERIAGLIFVYSPACFANSPILDHPGVPRVAISKDTGLPGVCHVQMNLSELIPRALDHLKQRGCGRIAVLLNSRCDVEADMNRLKIEAGARGICIPPQWYLPVDWVHPLCAESCLRLLFGGDQLERPDGLFICDDALLPAALEGLKAARLNHLPELVSHANFPVIVKPDIPVARVGFDISDLVSRCVRTIDAIRGGKKMPRVDTVPALFGHELTG